MEKKAKDCGCCFFFGFLLSTERLTSSLWPSNTKQHLRTRLTQTGLEIQHSAQRNKAPQHRSSQHNQVHQHIKQQATP